MTNRTPLIRDATTNLPSELRSGDTIAFSNLGSLPTTLAGYGITDALATITPAGYIDGLKMVWNSATSISVTSGTCYIQGSSAVISFPSLLTLSSLSLSASTFYHLYGYLNSGTPSIELVTTAPAAAYSGTARSKTGDTSRRYLGSVLTDASNNVFPFSIANGKFMYLGAGNAVFTVLTSGSATSSTSISLSGAIPITAASATGRLANNSTTVNFSIQQTVGGNNFVSIPSIVSGSGPPITVDFPVSSQACAYLTGGVGGSANITILGYIYER
jgi:hypothetical protein